MNKEKEPKKICIGMAEYKTLRRKTEQMLKAKVLIAEALRSLSQVKEIKK